MHVVNDLRTPGVVRMLDGEAGFDLAEPVPIAVVVVPGVLVIKLRHRSAFVFGPQPALVPVVHLVHAVRIQRRNQQENRVFRESPRAARRLFREQVVGELNSRKRRGDFRRVDRAGNQHHRLAAGDEFLRLVRRSFARIGQSALNFPEALQLGPACRARRSSPSQTDAPRSIYPIPTGSSESLAASKCSKYATVSLHRISSRSAPHGVPEMRFRRRRRRGRRKQKCQKQERGALAIPLL